MQPADQYFFDRFNTELSPAEEAAYLKWATKTGRVNDAIDYDMRGAWKSGAAQSDNGHYPDTYKKPNHPTFSDQSQYHGTDREEGGKWVGGSWSKSDDGKFDVYQPSKEMLSSTHDPEMLKHYFSVVEPNAILQIVEDK